MPQPDASKINAGGAVSEKKFTELSLLQKGAFVCKAVVFFVTFGIAFPNIFSD